MPKVLLPKEIADSLEELTVSVHHDGYEIPNPKPLFAHTSLSRPLTLQEQIRRLLRTEQMNKFMHRQGFETFDESNDFDIPDDELLHGVDDSRYTLMQDEFPAEEIPQKETTPSPPLAGSTEESPGDPPQSPGDGSPPPGE